jgi:hypothetical protein
MSDEINDGGSEEGGRGWGVSETIEILDYIAQSPAQEHGGFHENTVKAAIGALAMIAELRAALAKAEAERDSAVESERFALMHLGESESQRDALKARAERAEAAWLVRAAAWCREANR